MYYNVLNLNIILGALATGYKKIGINLTKNISVYLYLELKRVLLYFIHNNEIFKIFVLIVCLFV